MIINALCLTSAEIAAKHCDKLVFVDGGQAGKMPNNAERFVEYVDGVTPANIYIPSLADEDVLESACDYLISVDSAKAIVRTAHDLEETGIIEARYKLSPIMLLHKLGVLHKCFIAGGVCLDNDDMDLMAQENTPLIVLPTADAGYGYGFAPVCAALRRGVRVGIGTFDGKYNKTHDLKYEMEFLKLTANAEMRTENALSPSYIKKIFAFE